MALRNDRILQGEPCPPISQTIAQTIAQAITESVQLIQELNYCQPARSMICSASGLLRPKMLALTASSRNLP